MTITAFRNRGTCLGPAAPTLANDAPRQTAAIAMAVRFRIIWACGNVPSRLLSAGYAPPHAAGRVPDHPRGARLRAREGVLRGARVDGRARHRGDGVLSGERGRRCA